MPRFARFLSRIGKVGALVAVVATLSGCLSLSLTAPQLIGMKALNNDRAAHRLRALPARTDVQRKAQAWAEKLARENALYHSKITDGVRSKWCALAENVGTGSSVAAVEAAYMNSPHHRASILSSRYNGVGIGVVRVGSRVWVVQEFIQNC